MKTAYLLLLMFCGTAYSGNPLAVYNEDNLIRSDYFRPLVSFYNAKTLWQPHKKQKFEILDYTLVMKAGGKSNSAGLPVPIAYSTAEAFDVSFAYKADGRCSFAMTFGHMEKYTPKSVSRSLPPSSKWKDFKIRIPKSPRAMSAALTFYCSGENAAFSLKDLVVREVEPVSESGRKLYLNGKECEAIYWAPGDTANSYYDRKAAQMLRFALFRTGGKLIPVKKAVTESDYRTNAVFIGTAAEKCGRLAKKEISSVKEGGYVMKLTGNKLAIAGKRPGGVFLGVVDLLERMGISYLATDLFTKPHGDTLALKEFVQSRNPAVPMRLQDTLRYLRPELRGYSPHEEFANYRIINSFEGACHSVTSLLSIAEFGKTKPEFFALQADGRRMPPDTNAAVVQYCMSNTELTSLLAERLIEVMKADPYSTYYPFQPGDGAGRFCRCQECEKMGSATDRLLAWTNRVAEKTSRVFPEKKLLTFSYVDTYEPPVKVLPHKNVYVEYCPYHPEVWGSQIYYGHEYNKTGKEYMSAWEKRIPDQMAAFTYPVNYAEIQNVWPAFHANCEFSKRYARNRYRVVEHCFFVPTFGNGTVLGSHSFADLSIYVQARLLIDPETDIDSMVTRFMKHYYGPAAPAMRKYFDLINAEPEKRKWSQNCEMARRGFVTPELAAECLKYLHEAEAEAGQTMYRRYVLKEKLPLLWSDLTDNCRGTGKIAIHNFKTYAARLAEYCKTSRELGVTYVKPQIEQWFWNTAVYKIGKTKPWYDDPAVVRLMENPEKALGAVIPNCQEAISGGCRIPVKGLLGGQEQRSNWFRQEVALSKCLRRPTSGFGTVQAVLRLEKSPGDKVLLRIRGIDNEKKEKALMELLVNGKNIYRGIVPWGKRAWTAEEFTIPAGLLRKGENDIVIRNITQDTEVDGLGGVNFAAKRNYFWGWFMIDRLDFIIR